MWLSPVSGIWGLEFCSICVRSRTWLWSNIQMKSILWRGGQTSVLYSIPEILCRFFWEMLLGYQGDNRSFFDLLLPVNCISVPEEQSDRLKCSVFQFWSLSCEWCDAGTHGKVMTVTSLLQRCTAMITNTRCPLNKNAFRHIRPCPS